MSLNGRFGVRVRDVRAGWPAGHWCPIVFDRCVINIVRAGAIIVIKLLPISFVSQLNAAISGCAIKSCSLLPLPLPFAICAWRTLFSYAHFTMCNVSRTNSATKLTYTKAHKKRPEKNVEKRGKTNYAVENCTRKELQIRWQRRRCRATHHREKKRK